MESKDLRELSELYLKTVYEAKDESPEKEEEKEKEDDDLFGSPNKKNGKKKAKRWWDDDGDGKGYEKGEVKKEEYEVTAADKKGNTPAWQGYKAGKKNVKTGKPLYKAAAHLNKEQNELATKEIKDLQKGANTLKGKNIKKADKLADEVIHAKRALQEKQKDTPDQVKAVIAFDKARKGTDDATYDSEHGEKKKAKQERDYAKWQRDKGAEDAQKSGHPWEHAKGSTREKEGKKSEKHAHIKDSYDNQIHSTAIQGYGDAYQAVYENWSGNEQNELATKEVKALQKGVKTLKGKDIKKADEIADEYVPSELVQKLVESGKFSEEEIAKIVEIEKEE